MAVYTNRSWAFCGLIGAFIDLALAYFLLCGSTFVFLACKFCDLFGLCFPCPCTGFFWYENENICWHKLLIDWPRRKIFTVQMLIKSKFPFDLIWFDHCPCNLDMMLSSNRTYDRGILKLENQGSSSSFSSPKLQNLVDRESGFDARGKKVVNQKLRYGTRRRWRSALGNGKSSSKQSVVAGASCSACNWNDVKSQIFGKEDGLGDYGKDASGFDLGERTYDNFAQSGLFRKNKVKENDSSSVEKLVCNAQDNSVCAGNEENVIKMLGEALREEKAVCSALQSELEKERAASATAADEAMAKILRLQADKASVEMEARQYQRVIEEQFAYEEEEMNILKEILIRMEKENHFLKKEVEAYRQIKCLGNVQSEVDTSFMTGELGQKPSHSSDQKGESSYVQQEIKKRRYIGNNGSWHPIYEVSFAEEAVQTCSEIGENHSCCGDNILKYREHKTEECDTLHGPILDLVPIIYDVHVIDDKTELWNEEKSKESGLSNCVATDFGLSSGELPSDCSRTSIVQTNQNNRRNCFEMKNGVPELGNKSCSKNFFLDSVSSSSSAAIGERLKIDAEVELLIERLRIWQEGKEKLSFSVEQRESIHAQLKLVEDMLNQLRDIQELREPVRHASLPPPSSKLTLTERSCQSLPSDSKS